MYQLKVKEHFDAAHHLRGYEGKCANNHGHRWEYEVRVSGNTVNDLGILIDFVQLKDILKDVIDNRLDHQDLNTITPFNAINPTAENLAKWIFFELRPKLSIFPIRLTEVTIWESEKACASYSKD